MVRRIREHDWAATPLGPTACWPERLRGAVEAMLATPHISSVAVGPERLLLYNDAAARLYDDRHPAALGRPLTRSWPEAYLVAAPLYERAFAGETVHVPAQPLDVSRTGGEVFDVTLLPVRGPDGAVLAAHMTGFEIGAQSRAEAALRASAERQRFLLALGDAMRTQSNAQAIVEVTARLLGERLNPSRVLFAEFDEANGVVEVVHAWLADGATPFPVVVPQEDFAGPFLDDLRAGRTLWVDEAGDSPSGRPDLAALAQVGIKAALGVPLLIGGRLVAALSVHQHEPRRWTEGEVSLLQEVVERLWADVVRARAEAALRDSEEKYRSLFAAMDEGFCIIEMLEEADGTWTDYRFAEVNAAFERHTGLTDVTGKRGSEVAPGTEPFWIEINGEVARTGEAKRFENYHGARGRWYGVHASRVEGTGAPRVCIVLNDITEHRAAEAVLRESEERQAFLLKLSDALRAEPDAEAVENRAIRMLFEQMRVDRCYTCHYRHADDWGDLSHQVASDAVPPLPTGVPISAFPESFRTVTDGTLVIHDAATAEGLSAADREGISGALGQLAMISATLRKGEKNPIWGMSVASARPRRWTPSEVALLEEVAERTWVAMERARTETALRESEHRLSSIFASASVGLSEISPDGRFLEVNDELCRVLGRPREEVLGLTVAEVTYPEDVAASLAAVAEATRGGVGASLDKRYLRPDGSVVWAGSRVRVLPHADGRPDTLLAVTMDLTTRREAEAALRESEERFRTLVEGIPQLVWRAVSPGHWTWASPQWTAFTGQPEAESHEWGWLAPLHPDDRAGARAAWERSRTTGVFEADYRIQEADTGEFRWFQTRAAPVRDEAGRVVEWLGTSTDVQDLRELHERQQVLVAELQHRTRNLMGVVRSLADRTLAGSRSLEDFEGRFRDRLRALARVSGLLSRLEEGDRVTFDQLLEAELSAHGMLDADGQGEQVRLRGPGGIRLRSSTVQTMALGLHELATNAIKHGALSRPEGRLEVDWAMVRGPAGERRLRVDWRESGVAVAQPDGPAAPDGPPPPRRGYGRELIERALPYQLKAETSYELTPEGVRCTITLPVSSVRGAR